MPPFQVRTRELSELQESWEGDYIRAVEKLQDLGFKATYYRLCTYRDDDDPGYIALTKEDDESGKEAS